MKRVLFICISGILLVLLGGCNLYSRGELKAVGMLFDSQMEEQAWGKKGYKGLMAIQKRENVDVYYKENIYTENDVALAVNEFVENGVNLIFGHSNSFGKYFKEIASDYPDVHFVYFNGNIHSDNLTSLKFNGEAMGFFGGMVASKMTETNQLGIIGAFEWQPEIEGFYEGAIYQNPAVDIYIKILNTWVNKDFAIDIYKKMLANDIDVFYPTGDSFSNEIIERSKRNDVHTIGYVDDQLKLGKNTVLTSTVQHVDKLYEIAAERFDKGELDGGVLTFDFGDGVISLGDFSPLVPESFQQEIKESIQEYIETGKLPNAR
ncbi:BMP family ABC transporter substrate-binding protein [Virgibacillus halodenitrificans]|uniref:BMP family ABC transporter substrate-binding protein n=1 Tax=Virgibacillus halodenitrificans TaxID=1482 RepID=UPI002DBC2F0C|nr:BMP family ABC transporter substrate-binding protein [Virgibacillus halodenitrificans]MEC2158639.1 BMP family ABC transporter substrate-binding protein [Virgibacillus halodenitrificans]